jgi:methionyl-tRNA formyltransferase
LYVSGWSTVDRVRLALSLQNGVSVTETGRQLKIVYFGTPAYAVPALETLAADDRFSVELVVTQPDRPAGRRRQLQAPAVKTAALQLGLPVYQPERLRTGDERAPLAAQNADLFVVAAYGLIFGPKTLAIPRLGSLNLHASLLPRYRGASPISAAILAGDERTGVTLMRMDVGMDTGDMIATKSIAIEPDDTTGSLTERLGEIGAQLALDAIPRWIAGELPATPQASTDASLVRPLTRSDGWIDWTKPADELERQVRAMQPWPRAWTTLPDGSPLQIAQASVADSNGAEPGTVTVEGKFVFVATGDGSLQLSRVQPAGGAAVDAFAAVQGRRLSAGDRLGQVEQPERLDTPMIRPLV